MIIAPAATAAAQISGHFFEDGGDDRPPVILCLREAPACHTHSETPFGPLQVVCL